MAEFDIHWEEVITQLREGAGKAASAMDEIPEAKPVAEHLRNSLTFLDQIDEWIEKLPAERIRTSMFSFIKKLDTDLLDAVRNQKVTPVIYGATEEHPSAPFVEEVILSIGPEIVVSSDQMKVHVAIEPEFAHIWNADRIKAGLERMGLMGTILEKGLEEAVKRPGKSVKVMQGSLPVSGKDAVIEDCLGLDLDGIPSLLDRNRVDLKSLNWIHNVAQNQVLLKKKPATPGVPGTNVYGDEIPCRDGVDIPFPQVTNTGVTEDGLSLIALVDGCAYKDGNSLMVVPSLEIKQNVDYSTGHVNAEVTVSVNGDVLSGFKVESNNDIHVKGTVEGSRLNAKGNIFLSGGVQGKGEALIVSEKNIECKFVNAAQMQAKGEIIVHGSIIQSKLRARRIEACDQEADIIGGVLEAEEDICADTFGSDMGVKTVLRMGHDLPELTGKLEKLQEQIKQLEEKNKQCAENLAKLTRIEEQGGSLSPTQEKVKLKLSLNQKKIEEAIGVRLRQLELNEEAIQKAQEMKRMIRARKSILPGVEITILGHSFVPKSPTGPVTVFVTTEGIEQAAYEQRTFEGEEEIDE